jgi:predicted Rossmann fold nucleotide-binding protein DprA/Smf involved in DNA uptake
LGREEVHIDELVEKIELPVKQLATLLTSMEMRGIIEKLAGNVFISKY